MRLENERYEEIKQTVIDTFIEYDIKCVPINAFEMAIKMGLKVIPYSALEKEQLEACLKFSTDGFSVEMKNGDSEVAKDVCMQIAAAKPEYLNQEEVPEDVVNHEMEILKAQAMNEGKPAEIAEKMVQGRIGKFYGEICLLDQPFVKDPNIKVSDLLSSKGAKVLEFARIEKGEGLEKREENFAEEVAKQIKG